MYQEEIERLHSYARYQGTTASEVVRALIRRLLSTYQDPV